jgi:PhnB protein
MKAIIPYINFNGKCREAMTFYHRTFDGDLELQEVRGSYIEATWSGSKDEILHASLTVEGQLVLMGSDMRDQLGYEKGNDFALSMSCNSEDEAHNYYARLLEDGRILSPLERQFWGGLFGSLQDRFGIKWMVVFSDK